MDQADFQGASGYSAPVLFNGQRGDDPAISLTPACGFYWSETTATNHPGQAVDLAYAHPLFTGFVQPRGAGLPSSPAYTDFEQSPDASLLLSPANRAGFSGFLQPRGASLPSSPAYTDSEQSPNANLLLSPANHAGFSGFVLPPTAGLPSSPATDFGQSLDASLFLSPANYSGFSGFVPPPSAGLCLSPADSEQSPGASLDSNHANYQSCVRCRQQKKKAFLIP